MKDVKNDLVTYKLHILDKCTLFKIVTRNKLLTRQLIL